MRNLDLLQNEMRQQRQSSPRIAHGHPSIENLADQTFHIWVSEVADKLALLMHFSIHIHTYIYVYILVYICLVTSNILFKYLLLYIEATFNYIIIIHYSSVW